MYQGLTRRKNFFFGTVTSWAAKMPFFCGNFVEFYYLKFLKLFNGRNLQKFISSKYCFLR